MIGKGTARQALTQITGLVSDGNRDQTNQKGSSGTRKALVTIGKPPCHQTKSTNAIRSLSGDLGRDW
jgi:hypothetical protein